jgi:hypothetical protein
MGAREQVLAQITRYAHPAVYHGALARYYRDQGKRDAAKYHDGHELRAATLYRITRELAEQSNDITEADISDAFHRGYVTGHAQAQRVISVATAA